MLERLDDAFTSQERFAANASHELRTPLTVTATMLDVARAEEDSELLRRLQLTNARAIGADRGAAAARRRERGDGGLRAGGSRRQLAREAGGGRRARTTSLAGTGTSHCSRSSPRTCAATPLSTAPASTRITTPGATLRIESDGPEIASRPRAARGAVPARKRPHGGDGHGLGLALVARISEVHGGTLTLAGREGGGLVVTVILRSGRVPLLDLALELLHHVGVAQRGDVAELAALGDVAEQAAHDLAGTGPGRSPAQMMRFGRANLPMREATRSWISSISASVPSSSTPSSVTNAVMAWPVSSSAWPMTAASATFGCETIADSTSAVDSRWPGRSRRRRCAR